jgi:hypothetical protein
LKSEPVVAKQITVPYATDQITYSDIQTDAYSETIYTDSSFTTPVATNSSISLDARNTVDIYVKVCPQYGPEADPCNYYKVPVWRTGNIQAPLSLDTLSENPSSVDFGFNGGSGTGNYTLTAATSSGSICEIGSQDQQGAHINLLSSGVCELTLNKAADTDFEAATSVTLKFNVWTVNLNGNSMTFPSIAGDSVPESNQKLFFMDGDTFILPLASEANYSFQGWCSVLSNCANGTETALQTGAIVPVDSDLTYYAWPKIQAINDTLVSVKGVKVTPLIVSGDGSEANPEVTSTINMDFSTTDIYLTDLISTGNANYICTDSTYTSCDVLQQSLGNPKTATVLYVRVNAENPAYVMYYQIHLYRQGQVQTTPLDFDSELANTPSENQATVNFSGGDSTADYNLTVDSTSSSVCNIASTSQGVSSGSSVLNLTTAGNCKIILSKPGDGTYADATPINLTMVIYSVAFMGNNGEFTGNLASATKYVLANNTVLSPDTPTRAGYSFVNFCQNSAISCTSGQLADNEITPKVIGNLTYYAIWNALSTSRTLYKVASGDIVAEGTPSGDGSDIGTLSNPVLAKQITVPYSKSSITYADLTQDGFSEAIYSDQFVSLVGENDSIALTARAETDVYVKICPQYGPEADPCNYYKVPVWRTGNSQAELSIDDLAENPDSLKVGFSGGSGSGQYSLTTSSDSSSVCSIVSQDQSGAVINLLASGKCSITLQKAASGDFEAATPVSKTYQIWTVNFDGNGGKIYGANDTYPEHVIDGQTAETLAEPTYVGQNFIAWCSPSTTNCTTSLQPNSQIDSVTSDLTFVAKWNAQSVTSALQKVWNQTVNVGTCATGTNNIASPCVTTEISVPYSTSKVTNIANGSDLTYSGETASLYKTDPNLGIPSAVSSINLDPKVHSIVWVKVTAEDTRYSTYYKVLIYRQGYLQDTAPLIWGDKIAEETQSTDAYSEVMYEFSGGLGTGDYVVTSNSTDICSVASVSQAEQYAVINLKTTGTCSLSLGKLGDSDYENATVVDTSFVVYSVTFNLNAATGNFTNLAGDKAVAFTSGSSYVKYIYNSGKVYTMNIKRSGYNFTGYACVTTNLTDCSKNLGLSNLTSQDSTPEVLENITYSANWREQDHHKELNKVNGTAISYTSTSTNDGSAEDKPYLVDKITVPTDKESISDKNSDLLSEDLDYTASNAFTYPLNGSVCSTTNNVPISLPIKTVTTFCVKVVAEDGSAAWYEVPIYRSGEDQAVITVPDTTDVEPEDTGDGFTIPEVSGGTGDGDWVVEANPNNVCSIDGSGQYNGINGATPDDINVNLNGTGICSVTATKEGDDTHESESVTQEYQVDEVDFNGNGGSPALVKKYVLEGAGVLSSAAPTYPGFGFSKWCLNSPSDTACADSSVDQLAETPIVITSNANNHSSILTGSIYYAKWTIQSESDVLQKVANQVISVPSGDCGTGTGAIDNPCLASQISIANDGTTHDILNSSNGADLTYNGVSANLYTSDPSTGGAAVASVTLKPKQVTDIWVKVTAEDSRYFSYYKVPVYYQGQLQANLAWGDKVPEETYNPDGYSQIRYAFSGGSGKGLYSVTTNDDTICSVAYIDQANQFVNINLKKTGSCILTLHKAADSTFEEATPVSAASFTVYSVTFNPGSNTTSPATFVNMTEEYNLAAANTSVVKYMYDGGWTYTLDALRSGYNFDHYACTTGSLGMSKAGVNIKVNDITQNTVCTANWTQQSTLKALTSVNGTTTTIGGASISQMDLTALPASNDGSAEDKPILVDEVVVPNSIDSLTDKNYNPGSKDILSTGVNEQIYLMDPTNTYCDVNNQAGVDWLNVRIDNDFCVLVTAEDGSSLYYKVPVFRQGLAQSDIYWNYAMGNTPQDQEAEVFFDLQGGVGLASERGAYQVVSNTPTICSVDFVDQDGLPAGVQAQSSPFVQIKLVGSGSCQLSVSRPGGTKYEPVTSSQNPYTLIVDSATFKAGSNGTFSDGTVQKTIYALDKTSVMNANDGGSVAVAPAGAPTYPDKFFIQWCSPSATSCDSMVEPYVSDDTIALATTDSLTQNIIYVAKTTAKSTDKEITAIKGIDVDNSSLSGPGTENDPETGTLIAKFDGDNSSYDSISESVDGDITMTGVSLQLYSDSSYLTPINSIDSIPIKADTHVYAVVTAEDGSKNYYDLTVTRTGKKQADIVAPTGDVQSVAICKDGEKEDCVEPDPDGNGFTIPEISAGSGTGDFVLTSNTPDVCNFDGQDSITIPYSSLSGSNGSPENTHFDLTGAASDCKVDIVKQGDSEYDDQTKSIDFPVLTVTFGAGSGGQWLDNGTATYQKVFYTLAGGTVAAPIAPTMSGSIFVNYCEGTSSKANCSPNMNPNDISPVITANDNYTAYFRAKTVTMKLLTVFGQTATPKDGFYSLKNPMVVGQITADNDVDSVAESDLTFEGLAANLYTGCPDNCQQVNSIDLAKRTTTPVYVEITNDSGDSRWYKVPIYRTGDKQDDIIIAPGAPDMDGNPTAVKVCSGDIKTNCVTSDPKPANGSGKFTISDVTGGDGGGDIKVVSKTPSVCTVGAYTATDPNDVGVKNIPVTLQNSNQDAADCTLAITKSGLAPYEDQTINVTYKIYKVTFKSLGAFWLDTRKKDDKINYVISGGIITMPGKGGLAAPDGPNVTSLGITDDTVDFSGYCKDITLSNPVNPKKDTCREAQNILAGNTYTPITKATVFSANFNVYHIYMTSNKCSSIDTVTINLKTNSAGQLTPQRVMTSGWTPIVKPTNASNQKMVYSESALAKSKYLTLLSNATTNEYRSVTLTPKRTGLIKMTVTPSDKETDASHKIPAATQFKINCNIKVALGKQNSTKYTVFKDVKGQNGKVFGPNIQWALNYGVTTGLTAKSYAPASPVRRDQMAAFMYRVAGLPTYTMTSKANKAAKKFTDMPTNTTFSKAIKWLLNEGITTGTTTKTYAPAQAVNRAQMAMFLWRFAGSPTISSSVVKKWNKKLKDLKVPAVGTSHAKGGFNYAICWLAETGITTGVTKTTYEPTSPVRRDQMAAFLNRFYQNYLMVTPL